MLTLKFLEAWDKTKEKRAENPEKKIEMATLRKNYSAAYAAEKFSLCLMPYCWVSGKLQEVTSDPQSRKWHICASFWLAFIKALTVEKAKRYDIESKLPRSVGAQYANGEEWRNSSRKNEETEPKQERHLAVDVTSDGSKVCCCKEQYCIGTWNVRSMNQGKLEVVQQEMARVNINILGISELKWTGIGEFNSDDHYIHYCGWESLRRNEVAIIVNERVQNAVLECNLKNDRMISIHFQG